MKIAINISQIAYEGTGVARFTRGLVGAILKYDKNNTWTFFYSLLRKELDPDLKFQIAASRHRLVNLKMPPAVLDLIWNKLHILPFEKLVGEQDISISSDWAEPPSKFPKATIVHDLVFKRFPEVVDSKILATMEKRLAWVKKESSVIFTDSVSTKDDLIEFYGVDKNRIHVIYPGVGIEEPGGAAIRKTKEKFGLKKQYVLAAGKIEPRKNIKRLIEAFDTLEPKDVELVIVGPAGWDKVDVKNRNNIKFLGYVSDEELAALYAGCLVFAYPSLWEGFGYPVVEAMRLGAPVLTSNNSSLKEIAGEAALLCDPNSVDDIKEKLNKLITDSSLRNRLIGRGAKTSRQYTWENYYNKMMEVLSAV